MKEGLFAWTGVGGKEGREGVRRATPFPNGVFFDGLESITRPLTADDRRTEQFHARKRKRKRNERFNIYRGDNGFYKPLSAVETAGEGGGKGLERGG